MKITNLQMLVATFWGDDLQFFGMSQVLEAKKRKYPPEL